MGATIKCPRDGKDYPSSEMQVIGGVHIAKVNLTEAERAAYGITDVQEADAPVEAPTEAQPETPEATAPDSTEPSDVQVSNDAESVTPEGTEEQPVPEGDSDKQE